jgi:ElaB/YqjD/DUF883 family membrane-anchored ribosome-binding protein
MAKTTNKRNFVNSIKDNVHETYDNVRERAEEAKDKTEDIIKKHPFASIAIAAAVGAAVALGVSALTRHERKPFMRRFRDYFD